MKNLEQYLKYNNDPETIRIIALTLDKELELFHKKGYGVDIDPSKIVRSEDGMFDFTSVTSGVDESEKRNQITALAKLAVGCYHSLPSGQFVDYTKIPTSVLKDDYDRLQIDSSILKEEGDSYYRDVIVNGNNGVYYNNYLVSYRASQDKINNSSKTSEVVKSLGTIGSPNTVKEIPNSVDSSQLFYTNNNNNNDGNNKQAAFIDIIFYPILLAVFAMVGYAISIIIRVL